LKSFKKLLAFEMLFNFSIQTKHFITKKSKFFKKMNCFIKILYPNTLLVFLYCDITNPAMTVTYNFVI